MKKRNMLAAFFALAVITGILWNLNFIASVCASSFISARLGMYPVKFGITDKLRAEKTGKLYAARAAAYSMRSNFSRALADYAKSIEIYPQNIDIYPRRAEIYMKTGNFQKAADDLKIFLDSSTDIDKKIEAANQLTNAYIKLKQPEKAIFEFDKLVKEAPLNPSAYRYRGSAYGKAGNFDKAMFDYSKAIEIDPKNADFYYGRGVFYYRKDDFKNAILDFNKAIELNPEKVSALYNRGTTYYRMGNDEAAYADFVKVMKLRPFKSVFKMRILYKLAAVGITEMTGYRMDKGHSHRRSGRQNNEPESIYVP